jgi:diacylglycerol kinase family enzyme
MNVIISVNPKAGRRSSFLRAQELLVQLELRGFQVELLTDIEEALVKANRFFAEGCLRAIVGVGGDGTAATLVNRTAQGTPITILPAGTANLISKHFRLPNSPAKLADVIENGKLITLDAGKVTFADTCNCCTNKNAASENSENEDANKMERIFLVMLSCGFDADIVNGVHARREERYKA